MNKREQRFQQKWS